MTLTLTLTLTRTRTRTRTLTGTLSRPTANLRGYRATAALAGPPAEPEEGPRRELFRRARPPLPPPLTASPTCEYCCPGTTHPYSHVYAAATRNHASQHQPSPPTPHQEPEPAARWPSQPSCGWLRGGRGRHHSATGRTGTVRAL